MDPADKDALSKQLASIQQDARKLYKQVAYVENRRSVLIGRAQSLGMTVSEIADTLEVSKSMVYRVISKRRGRLRK